MRRACTSTINASQQLPDARAVQAGVLEARGHRQTRDAKAIQAVVGTDPDTVVAILEEVPDLMSSHAVLDAEDFRLLGQLAAGVNGAQHGSAAARGKRMTPPL